MKRLLLIIFGFSLTSCGMLASERVPCPKTAIIAEFSKSLDFHKKTPIRTEMDSLIPKCSEGDHQTIVDFRLRTTSFRPLGSFHVPMTIKPSYFVAVVDNAGNVLFRSNHNLEVTFEEKQTTKVNFIPLREKVPSHKDVSVYVGFNLDENQLNLLRKERNKNVHNHRP